MFFNMENYISSSKLLFEYLTRLYGFNNFIVDEVNDELVKELRNAILSEDRIGIVQAYLSSFTSSSFTSSTIKLLKPYNLVKYSNNNFEELM